MKTNKLKKNAIKIAILLGVIAVTMICINLPIFAGQNSNISLVMTVIFASVIYAYMKDFSKRIAVSCAILLFFIYVIFAWALAYEATIFTRGAIVLTQTAILLFAYVCGRIAQEKTTQKIKQEVSKYVSEKVLDKIDDDDISSTVGTKELLTVMFIDMRGFTAISEKYPVEKVIEILNTYYREIVPVIKKYNGVVNKYIGDAILAVFSDENPEIHARNAVKAGKAILKKLKYLQEMQEANGEEKSTAGIGISTGEVFVGHIGTSDRCEYTVIGDTVNLANRTESVNRVYKTEILITEKTYPYVKSIADVIKISDVEMKGKRERVNIYEVLRVVV